MIEDVEGLDTEFDFHSFMNPCVLEQRHVKVVDSRPGKEHWPNIAELPHRFRCEEVGIEIRIAVPRVFVLEEVTSVVGKVRFIDVGSTGADKRVVVLFEDRDGRSAGKDGDAGQRPTFGQSARNVTVTEEPLERQMKGIADRQVIWHIRQ